MAAPSDLIEQKNAILDILATTGLCQVEMAGVEADDLIASVVNKFKNKNEIFIVSSDKDLAQLLDQNIKIYDPFKEEIVTKEIFQARRGFPVEHLPLFHALLGDASDNIPGVKGIGEKTASGIASKFGSLDELYQNLSQAGTERVQKLLSEAKANAYLSYDLFLLRNFNLELSLAQIKFTQELWSNAYSKFAILGFRSLLPTNYLIEPSKQTPLVNSKGYLFKPVTNMLELEGLVKEIKEKKHFAIDTETTSIDTLENCLVGISFCCAEGTAYYLPVDKHSNIEFAELKKILDSIFTDPTISKYLHNAKFDLAVLRSAGFELAGIASDTMIAANLLNTPGNKRGLKDLSQIYLNEQMQSFQEVVFDQGYSTFAQVPLKEATAYAAADAHQTFRLVSILHNELKNANLWQLYVNIELPLVNVLFEMEYRGIFIDQKMLSQTEARLDDELQKVFTEFVSISGVDNLFNINSPKQVGQLLFEKLGLTPQGKTKTGSYATSEEALSSLKDVHPVPQLILKHRELFKLKSVYAQGLQKEIKLKTGTIHTNYNQIAVATGRLSSQEPNLQNIPISNDYGMAIRKAFKPRPGHVFISADYSQIELRVLAYLSQDQALMKAFTNEQDIHIETAARLFGTTLSEVKPEQRQIGKKINFSILYGLTAYGLSKDLSIPVKEASSYIESYFQQFPGVKKWMEDVILDVQKNGYVLTTAGRRRYFPEIFEKNKTMFEMAKRSAINTVAQGTAAEIVKLGMINLTGKIKELNIAAQILLQIHDELLIEVPESQAAQMQKVLKEVLESVVAWPIPLRVSIAQGMDWAEVS
jgi:DNA polymerase-1